MSNQSLDELDEQIANLICEHGVMCVLASVKRFISVYENVKKLQGLEPIHIKHAGEYIDRSLEYLYANQTQNKNTVSYAPSGRGNSIPANAETREIIMANETRQIPAGPTVDKISEETKP